MSPHKSWLYLPALAFCLGWSHPAHAVVCNGPLTGITIKLYDQNGTTERTCVNPNTTYRIKATAPFDSVGSYAAYCIFNTGHPSIKVPLTPFGFTVPSGACQDASFGTNTATASFTINTTASVPSFGIIGAVSPYCYDYATNTATMYTQEQGFRFPRCTATTAACIAPPSSMAAWYTMDESSGTTVNDVIGTAEATRSGALSVTGGRVGRALDFDGTDDYASAPSNSALNFGTGDFSLDAWIKTTDSNGVIASKRAYVNGKYVGYLFMVYNGRLLLQISDSTNSWANYYPTSGPTVNDNAWHLVGFSVDRDNPQGGRLFRDGVVVHTFNPTGRAGDTSNSAPLDLGRTTGGGDHFDGIIDEVEIFNRVLGLSEINAIYQNGAAGKCKPVQPQPLAASVYCYANDANGASQSCYAYASGGSGGYSFQWSTTGSGYITPAGDAAELYIYSCPGSVGVSVTVTDSAGASTTAWTYPSCYENCTGGGICPQL